MTRMKNLGYEDEKFGSTPMDLRSVTVKSRMRLKKATMTHEEYRKEIGKKVATTAQNRE